MVNETNGDLANPELPVIIQFLKDNNIPSPLIELEPFQIAVDEFKLETAGEHLIYNSIKDWLIKGNEGKPREILHLSLLKLQIQMRIMMELMVSSMYSM